MKLKSVFIITLLVYLPGCSWWNYQFPKEQDFQAVNTKPPSYILGVQNFNDDELSKLRLEAVRKALSDVQDIFINSKKFESMIINQSWVSSCDLTPPEKISGAELLSNLRRLNIKVSVYPKKPWLAIGLTDTLNSRIAIDPIRIDFASGNELIDASLLIETTAHELTHLVVNEAGLVKYRDAGHGKEGCSNNELASYRIGKTAQAVWIYSRVSEK